jgi:hypothetical protein
MHCMCTSLAHTCMYVHMYVGMAMCVRALHVYAHGATFEIDIRPCKKNWGSTYISTDARQPYISYISEVPLKSQDWISSGPFQLSTT